MKDANEVVEKARSYYDSSDADEFYFNFWGGEDIHIGIYDPPGIPVKQASLNTVRKIASHVEDALKSNAKVLDLGAGYGGAARYLAKTYGCHVTCLNLSSVENDRNRQLSEEQGLSHLIDVVDGNFEELPFDRESFDLIWSEDAILHSGNKTKVFEEIYRVLNPKGNLIFTDPMQADNVKPGVLQPILERIHLESMGSVSLYKNLCDKLGFEFIQFEDFTNHLPIHYGTIRKIIQDRRFEIEGKISNEFLDRMSIGLGHWVDGGLSGYLRWGILHFRKN
ncbi:MAG: methyltransferase domain-containing protein [Leptospira sp.]|nr:methyltransferase domain-containing protein [Leptospira sp.]